MNPKAKRLIIHALLLVVCFFAGQFYRHITSGHHYELHEEKRHDFELGGIHWQYATDSIGLPFLDPGTTKIIFDDRVLYEAKRGFQESAPYARNIETLGNQIRWDDGDYRYQLDISKLPKEVKHTAALPEPPNE